MYCPSCENLMPDDSKYCGRCGMFLNKSSDRLVQISQDTAWIWRRSWAGFVSGFIGWVIIFIIGRIIKQNLDGATTNVFLGMLSGVFLGTVGGIIEESSYKAVLGGLLGAAGGALGGLLTIPLTELLRGNERFLSLSVVVTWAVGGAFIGAVSGIIEKSRRKVIAGVLFGFIGGGIGGFLGSIFYGSINIEFAPTNWFANRLAEGLSGGLVGSVLWFFIGTIEKFYIFHRREDPKLEKKVCDHCGKHSPLRFWYCASCGHVLQIAAPRQKIRVTPYRGIERMINALRFMSWLFGVTGVIGTPIIFITFLFQDVFLAAITSVFAVLFTYLMVVGFRFLGDTLSCLVKIASLKTEEKA